MLAASSKLNLSIDLDRELFNHIAYVTNQSLLVLKKDGVGKPQLEKICKMLWRLYLVTRAYQSKNRDITLGNVLSIIEEFKNTFSVM